MTHDEEKILIVLAQRGDTRAYAKLVEFHQLAVRRFVASVVRDHGVADDLAQDVFVEAFGELSSYTGSGSLAAWLFGIAKNRIKMHHRTESRFRARVAQLAYAGWNVEPFHGDLDPGALALRIQALGECLGALPVSQAEVVKAHYFEHTSLVEIARGKNKREEAIRVGLFRIRLRLKRCLEAKIARGDLG